MIIGLVGPAGAGKSKAARHLVKRYGFRRIHAGQPVKDALRAAGRLDKDAVERRSGKDRADIRLGGATPRAGLDAVGEAIHRSMPRLTGRRLAQRISKALARGRDIVIDGIRQEGEAEAVRKAGGRLVCLDNGSGPDESLKTDALAAAIRADGLLKVPGRHVGKKLRRQGIEKAIDEMMRGEFEEGAK